MNRIQSILRGATSIFRFDFNINGNYSPPQFIDVQEFPPLLSPGDAIASYWQATGNYLCSAMTQFPSNGDSHDTETQE